MRHVSAIGLALLLGSTGCQGGQQSSAAAERRVDQVVSAVDSHQDHWPINRAGTSRASLATSAEFQQAIATYMATRPSRASVMVEDLRTGATFDYQPYGRFITASVMKVNILTGLLLQRQVEHRILTGAEQALAAKMIRYSDNSAADALYRSAQGAAGISQVDRRLGLPHTIPSRAAWGATHSCPADQLRLLHTLTDSDSPLNVADRRYVLRLMGSVTPGQRWGIGTAALPGDRVVNKNGWTPMQRLGVGWAVNSIGRITGHGHDFLIAVFTAGEPQMKTGIEVAEYLATVAVSALRR